MFNTLIFLAFLGREQPPSCGCVLKPWEPQVLRIKRDAAAFVRLCVETMPARVLPSLAVAAAFVRLCVETSRGFAARFPPVRSRLRAAVC